MISDRANPDAATLLLVHNHHIDDCGPPPEVVADGLYVSYFTNNHGEQWVFVGDRAAGTATVYGGDIGWRDPVIVAPNQLLEFDPLLNGAEQYWLIACLAAFRREQPEQVLMTWPEAQRDIARRTRGAIARLIRLARRASEASPPPVQESPCNPDDDIARVP
jgi:hypothetical protein